MLKWLDTLNIHSYGLILGHNENRSYHKQLDTMESIVKAEETSSKENFQIENEKLISNNPLQENSTMSKEALLVEEAKLEEKSEIKSEDKPQTKMQKELEAKLEEIRQ